MTNYSAYVPTTATAAKDAAEKGLEMVAAWIAYDATLPESMPKNLREALCDIFKRSWYIVKKQTDG